MDGVRELTVEEVERSEELIASLGEGLADLHPVGAWLSCCPGCGVGLVVEQMSHPGVLFLFAASASVSNFRPVLPLHCCAGLIDPKPFIYLPKGAKGEGSGL